MKHFGIQRVIQALSGMAEEMEQQLSDLPQGNEQDRRVQDYVDQLDRIMQALGTLPKPLNHYFPNDPEYHGWLAKRHQIAKESSEQALLESIRNVPPHELHRSSES